MSKLGLKIVKPQPESRIGLRGMTSFVKNEAHRQLGIMAAEKECSRQDLIAEALNLLFAKYGRNQVA